MAVLGCVQEQLTNAPTLRLAVVPVVVLRGIELQPPAGFLGELGRTQGWYEFLPLLDGATADADCLSNFSLGTKMSNDFGSTHDAKDSLLSGVVKYASTERELKYPPMTTSMGQRIKTLREAKGMTQAQRPDSRLRRTRVGRIKERVVRDPIAGFRVEADDLSAQRT